MNTLGLYSQTSNLLATNYHNSSLNSNISSSKYIIQDINSNLTNVLGNTLQDIYKSPVSSLTLSKGLYNFSLSYNITNLDATPQSLGFSLLMDNSFNHIYSKYDVISSTSTNASFSTSSNSIFCSETNNIYEPQTITSSTNTTKYKIIINGIIGLSDTSVITPQFSSSATTTLTPIINKNSYVYFVRISPDASIYSN
jgi:hypothetical protein